MMGYHDLTTNTDLFCDMSICAEILHCSHKEFLKLPRVEQEKLRLYIIVKNMKFDKMQADMKRESQKERDLEKNMPNLEITKKRR